MKDLMKSNIYEGAKEIIVVGSCLEAMQPGAYKALEDMRLPIFEVCLEQTHINMVITKILGMIRAKGITRIIFATVDKSPHCIQLHYIQDELSKLGFDIHYTNYIAVDNRLYEISQETIALSKNLIELSKRQDK